MPMTELLRNHRLTLYAVFSSGLVAAVVLKALQNHSNFFAAAFAMSQNNGSIMAMLNMALVATVIFGIGVQKLFFGELRALEIERLHERSWYFMTEIFLAFTAFREQFSVTHAVMLLQLLFIKCFHWLLSDRIEAIDQLPYPGPKVIDHFRLVSLMFILWIIDVVVLTYALDAVMQDGVSIVVLFVNEYAILCVAVIHSALKYCLHVYELLRARTRGGATAPPWEDKSLYNFYIDLATSFTEVMIYLSYFTILTVLYAVPFHAIRDVYISVRYLWMRTMDFIRYRKAVKNMKDKYSDATFEELRDMNDKTCIICRDELIFRGTPPATEGIEGQQLPLPPPTNDGPNDTPKKLPCGHIFHSHCLRSWLERQQTCPTCRRSVLEQRPAMQNAAPQPVQPGGPNQAAINQAAANDPLLARLIGQRQQQQQRGAHGQQPVQAGHAPPIAGAPQPGAAPGRPPANAIPGAHVFLAGAADARQVVVQPAPDIPLRDPRRFEGFYLMPNAYAQWGGGALLPRDPTQPAFVPQVPQSATQRTPQLPYGPGAFTLPQPYAANLQTHDPSRGTEGNINLPPTPAIQSTQPPTSLSWQPVRPPTPRLNAALDSSSSRRSSMSTSSGSSPSSEEEVSAPSTPTEATPATSEDRVERRRAAMEAVLRRHTARQGTPGRSPSISLPSPASLGFQERPIASPSKSIFTSDKSQTNGQEAAASNQPRSSLFIASASTSAKAAAPTPTTAATAATSTPSASTIANEKPTSAATIVLPGSVPVASPQGAGAGVRSLFGGMTGEQYGVRTDAPSFIPLYNNFTPQPAYGPAGPMQPWAHRPSLAGQPTTQTQTIRANSPYPPQFNTPVVPSQHTVTSPPPSRPAASLTVTPSVGQITPTLQLPTPSSVSRPQPMEAFRTPVAPPRPPETDVRLNGEDWNARLAQPHQARQRQEIQSSALRGPARPSRPVGASSPFSLSPPSAPNSVGSNGSGSTRALTSVEIQVRDIDELTRKRISDQLRALQNVEQMTRRAIAELQSVQGRLFTPSGETAESVNRQIENVPATTRSRESQAESSATSLNSGTPPSIQPSTSTRQGHERETSEGSLVEVGPEEALEDGRDTRAERSIQKSEEATIELPYYSC